MKNMADIFNTLICGVGGQGVILLGDILRKYGMKVPWIKNIVGTETRGVSQREGSVISTVRYLIENKVYSLDEGYDPNDYISPMIPINGAHLVMGLEPLETLRNIKYISEKTVIIFNTRKRLPKNLLLGKNNQKKYPNIGDILELLDQFARKTISMDFEELSKVKFNNTIHSNMIMLGVAVKEFLEIYNENKMEELLNEFFGKGSINHEAFELGFNLIDHY